MESLEDLWLAYKRTSAPEARETVIAHAAYLVKYVLGRMSILLPETLEYDDLVSAGSIGLIDAVERYDPARNVKFSTYAAYRIRGSILDFLRSNDTVSRGTRDRIRDIKAACAELEEKLGKPPSEDEVAGALGISIDELHEALEKASVARMLSLDRPSAADLSPDDDAGGALIDTIRDPDAPDLMAESAETRDILKQALDALEEHEKLVISLYYYDGLTLKEIARIMKLTESRICQLHGKAIFKLRLQLNKSKTIVALLS